MVIAYVLVQTQVGRVGEALGKIRIVRGVVEAHAVTGEYDVVCKIEAQDLSEVKRIVVEGIHRIEGILRTITLISVE